jgi:uracil-DNA glycosylase family 4
VQGQRVTSDRRHHALSLPTLEREIIGCTACPRLVAWREAVAARKRRAYATETYWGRPVPGFGDPKARLLLLGLAPGAHGANRTGRAFTGDRSGDFLYAALHRAGLSNQPHATGRDDGLRLRGTFILLVVRCAPPDNRPEVDEIERCSTFLDREIALHRQARVVLALGAVAWNAYLGFLKRHGARCPRPAPPFRHGAELLETGGHPSLVGSYHVSQQNTQTGRLSPAMFDRALRRAIDLAF